MKLRFDPAASDELDDAIRQYNRAKDKLGDEFSLEVADVLEDMLRFPNACPLVEGGARRRRTGRFPYGIVYRLEGDTIVVYAVMHLHRRPGY